MGTIAQLMVKLGLDSSKFQKGMNESEKQTGKFRKTLGTVGKVAAGATAAVGAVGAGLFAMANRAASAGDEIAKTSTKLGVSTDAYQEMEYWASQNGIAQNAMERAVGRLNQRIGRATDGNEKYAEAFQAVNVSLKDTEGNLRSTEDVMYDTIDALRGIEDPAEQSAKASEIFGTKMARDLMPALQDGSLSLEEAAQRAHELGIVMDEDATKASEKFQDSMDDVKRVMGTVTRDIGIAVMPVFQSMLEWILRYIPVIKNTFQTVFGAVRTIVGGVVSFIGNILGSINDAWERWGEGIVFYVVHTFGLIRDTIVTVLGTIWETVTDILESLGITFEGSTEGFFNTVFENFYRIMDTINYHIGQAKYFIEQNLENIQEFFDTYFRRNVETTMDVFESIKGIIENIIGDIVPFIQDQLQVIRDFWEEHGATIQQATENVFTAIQAIIEFVMPIIEHIIGLVWENIKHLFETAIRIILGLIQTFSGLFTGDFEQMKDGLISIWESLWDFIKGFLGRVWSLLSPVFSTLWDNISSWFIGLKDDAIEWGKNMIQGFIDGMRNMFGNIRQAASDAVSAVGDFLKFWSPAKKGEGRFIVDWGENMVDGFLDGVKNAMPELQRTMNQVIPDMSPQVQQAPAAVMRESQPQLRQGFENEQSNNQPVQAVLNIAGREVRGFIQFLTDEQEKQRDRDARARGD